MKSKSVLLVFVVSVMLCSCSQNGLYNSKNTHKNSTKNHEVNSNGLYAYEYFKNNTIYIW